MLSYNTRLLAENPNDLEDLRKLLEWERLAFNEASRIQFKMKKNSIVQLHAKFYRKFRNKYPRISSQAVIRGELACLSSYKGAKSNKRKSKRIHEKRRLSIRLDKNLYTIGKSPYSIRIATANKRKTFKFILYPKLKDWLDRMRYCDPLLYVDENDQICISFTFKHKAKPLKQKLCLGVDLGARVVAACSDGRLIRDKGFNARKRQLRFLRRRLQSKGTKSARRHLVKLHRTERNRNKNQTHLVANIILQTEADTIALENLKGIKAKKHPGQNKNRISQVPLFALRTVITHKALNAGKSVVAVNPAYTSQTDSLTGKREGERRGRRFYAKSGLVYDADLNAARNIGQRSKLPVSLGNLLDGQGTVNCPNVCKTLASAKALQVPKYAFGAFDTNHPPPA